MAIKRCSAAMVSTAQGAGSQRSTLKAGVLTVRVVSLLGCLLLATACARGTAKAPEGGSPNTAAVPEQEQEPKAKHTRITYPVPETFHGVRVRDGASLSADELLIELSEADAICVGEQHDNPHHHWAQYRVLSELIERRSMTGRQLALGLEMVARKAQPALSRWSRRDSRTPEALSELNWHETWGFDFGLYEPLWRLARHHRVELLALNLERETTKKIAKLGIRGLSDEERETLPHGMHFGDRKHRAYFERAMAHHPPPVSSQRRYYEAQVAWDETMANTAAQWLVKRQPARQILILAGLGHCQDSAIPKRLRRRAAQAQAVSVRPWIEGEEPPLPKLLEAGDFDYVMVLSRDRAESAATSASHLPAAPPTP